jgi:hypothetical protein
LLFLRLFVRMRCRGTTGPATRYRPCRVPVRWFLGPCQHHGRGGRRRVLATFGGTALLDRRTCDKCGRPRVFGRIQDSGAPFLGCARFPNCKNPRLLSGYTF